MKTITRKNFLRSGSLLAGGYFVIPSLLTHDNNAGQKIMTVNGFIPSESLGTALCHEHILVDFIGADKVSPGRYDVNEVFNIALPKLKQLKNAGCNALIECTPAYLGRDPRLLKKLSTASGIQLITNTGYYGAAHEKFVPAHAYEETAEQIAGRWIDEWENGIDGSGVRPGFIKTSVDDYPLTPVQRKIVEAAAITHLYTGLTIGIHTGDGRAAMEELTILSVNGVAPNAWIWIHAQNEKNRSLHLNAAKQGGWVEFDAVSNSSTQQNIDFLKDMQKEKLLGHVLISQDSGWYHVGEVNGGTYNDYNTIFKTFIPALRSNGFSEKEIELILNKNPAKAFSIRVRKK